MSKRILDLSLSMLALIFLSPVILSIGVIILITLGNPILFIQKRPGINSNIFTFYKFRTMMNITEKNSTLLSDKDRITKFGSFLRRTSLDELPSLINVIINDMSLVGPRPLLTDYIPLYSEEQLKRQEVKPGITGWAQINGRNKISWEEKFELDIWYIKNRTFYLDIKILFFTIWKVLLREGISYSQNETMPKFEGSSNE